MAIDEVVEEQAYMYVGWRLIQETGPNAVTLYDVHPQIPSDAPVNDYIGNLDMLLSVGVEIEEYPEYDGYGIALDVMYRGPTAVWQDTQGRTCAFPLESGHACGPEKFTNGVYAKLAPLEGVLSDERFAAATKVYIVGREKDRELTFPDGVPDEKVPNLAAAGYETVFVPEDTRFHAPKFEEGNLSLTSYKRDEENIVFQVA